VAGEDELVLPSGEDELTDDDALAGVDALAESEEIDGDDALELP